MNPRHDAPNSNNTPRNPEPPFREGEPPSREGEPPGESRRVCDGAFDSVDTPREEGEPPGESRRVETHPGRLGGSFALPRESAFRRKPAHGVVIHPTGPTIVFLTVCTKDRRPWLAGEDHHQRLREVWTQATAWLVGRYVLMPDHLHLFAAPGPMDISLDNWVRYWKSWFTRSHNDASLRWQTDHWDTRLRTGESYEEKWWYVRNNPVRAGLVTHPDDWPFQGELNLLEW